MDRKAIEALPNDPAALKRHLILQADKIASFELAKAQRAAAEQVAAASPAADFEMKVFEAKNQLEGLADGSEDITDPISRNTILRSAIKLVGDLFAAIPKA
jgi:hypothetical protein